MIHERECKVRMIGRDDPPEGMQFGQAWRQPGDEFWCKYELAHRAAERGIVEILEERPEE